MLEIIPHLHPLTGAFYLYMCVSGAGVVLFYFLLPESRGLPIEQVSDNLET